MGTYVHVFHGLSIETLFEFSVAKRCVWARLRNVSVVFVFRGLSIETLNIDLGCEAMSLGTVTKCKHGVR